MAYSKKRLIAAAMAGVLAMMSAFPGYAASRKKITSVSVSIKADIEPETDFGQEIIEIESSSNRYSVDGYEILNEGFYWTEDMTPEIRITLTADDDYYFASGFLYGLTCGYSLEKCAKIGSILSGNVIQVIGTSMSKERWNEIKLNINKVLAE